jgi:hypothetical protein
MGSYPGEVRLAWTPGSRSDRVSNLWDYRPVVWDYRESTWTVDGDLVGYGVVATDGDVGTIDHATAEAAGAYVVVELGPGVPRGKRVIPAGEISALDHGARLVQLSLTRADVRDAPAFEPDRWGEDERRELGQYYGSVARA